MVQLATDGAAQCDYSARFFSCIGALLGTQAGTGNGAPKLNVWNTAFFSGLAGQAGSARITHTCCFGNRKGKLAALEPATGFSFETPCTTREQ